MPRHAASAALLAALVMTATAHAAASAVHKTPAAAADRITDLPGLAEPLPFDMYSGYITVNKSHGRALFYWYNEAAENPDTAPVLVWLQGGPGCSSLLGLMMENGPIVPLADGGVKPNPTSWNRFANTLYIESPAGVGFSYSNTSSDYNTDNNKTSEDTYLFLQGFLERFPHTANLDWWFAGESYGGDYVPQIVSRVLTQGTLRSQLAGFIIGNPVFSCPEWEATENNIQVNLFYWHGLIPLSSYNEWNGAGCATDSASKACTAMLNTFTDQIGWFDPDNLYTDKFTGNASLGVGPTPARSIQELLTAYLNSSAVQEAIHARPTSWVGCCAEPGQSGGACALNYTNHWTNQMPLYERFFIEAPHLRVLIYSGDVDIATCPHPYAQLCLSTLKRPQSQAWAPWTMQGQTAGYSEVYDRYTYATVKGAGHEVPLFQPRAAYQLVSGFVAGKNPTESSS